jgi:hypothetical protein
VSPTPPPSSTIHNHRELPPSLRHLMPFKNQKLKNFKIFNFFHKFQKISKFSKFQKFQESYVIKQLVYLNLNITKYGIVRNTLFLYNCKSTKCNNISVSHSSNLQHHKYQSPTPPTSNTINKFQKISKFSKFQKFQESYVIKQLVYLNLINMEKKIQKTWNVIKQLRHFTACYIMFYGTLKRDKMKIARNIPDSKNILPTVQYHF